MNSLSNNRKVDNHNNGPIIVQTVSYVSQHFPPLEMEDGMCILNENGEDMTISTQGTAREVILEESNCNTESVNPSSSRGVSQTFHISKLVPSHAEKSFDVKTLLRDFWPSRKRKYDAMTEDEVRSYVRHMELPMARVKKIMKLDDSVRNQMISGDAPLVLSAAAEMFIQEITLRAWHLVDEGRRKTLQKCDIVAACSRSEAFDFLIDIVPRDESRRNQIVKLAQYSNDDNGNATASPQQPIQYVMADCETSGNNVIQLDNGQVLHATAIGQPIPLTDPSISFDISHMQLPPGVQIVQMHSQQ